MTYKFEKDGTVELSTLVGSQLEHADAISIYKTYFFDGEILSIAGIGDGTAKMKISNQEQNTFLGTIIGTSKKIDFKRKIN